MTSTRSDARLSTGSDAEIPTGSDARFTIGQLATRAVVGAVIAGAAFLAVNMWFATSMGDPAKGPLLMMSTIVMGDEAMQTGEANVGLGLAAHAALSLAFAFAFAALSWRLRGNGTLAIAGTAYGALLYLINFKVLSPTLFTTFEMANQPFELVAHGMFGTILSVAFFSLAPAAATAAWR